MAKRVAKKKTPTKVETLAKATKKALANHKKSAKKTPKTTKTMKAPPKPIQYTRISEKASIETFIEMGKKVRDGEFVWAFYGIDGNIGYHNYKKMK